MRNIRFNLWTLLALIAMLVAPIFPCVLLPMAQATALTDNRDTLSVVGAYIVLTVKNDEVIYAGSLVSVDSSGEAVSATDASGDNVIGRAEKKVDNSADGETIKIGLGIFRWANADTITDANIGDICYVRDDQTVSVTNSGVNAVIAGTVHDVDSSGVWVRSGKLDKTAGAFSTLTASGAATFSSTVAIVGVATFTAESVHNGGIDADYITTDAAAGIDTKTAGALPIGAATATSVTIGASDITTSISGPLTAPRWTAANASATQVVLTSSNYGTIVTVTNLVAVGYTLPANGAAAGAWIEVAAGASSSDATIITVKAATLDTLVGPNDVDLDSITFATGHRINSHARFWSDGSFWHVQNLGGTTMTYTD